MGDRANVCVQGRNDKRVYLYSHNGGSWLPKMVQTALRRRLRWDDSSYLARIIFSEMVKEDIEGELGYGISVTPPDNEHMIIVVDTEKCEVRFECPSRHGRHSFSFPESSWSMEDYCNLNWKDINKAYNHYGDSEEDECEEDSWDDELCDEEICNEDSLPGKERPIFTKKENDLYRSAMPCDLGALMVILITVVVLVASVALISKGI